MGSLGENDSVSSKTLFAFDCDHTILDTDSDVAIADLGNPLPPEVKALNDGHYWTDYMNGVFRHLYNKGFCMFRIGQALAGLPKVRGMKEVLHLLLKQDNVDVIVISDANDYGIRRILGRLLNNQILANKIPLITNRAIMTEEGCLHINPFHWQTECSICPPNLCKGRALKEFMGNKKYDRIVYVGDGKNDVCPASRLSGPNDLILARREYPLHKQIETGRAWNSEKIEVQVPVKLWSDGHDISKYLISSLELSL